MTNSDLIDLFSAHIDDDERAPVTVRAGDYSYDGWLIMVGKKRGGAIRCVVEDHNGRCFIHSATQIRTRDA